jgi:hypothetical protein
MSIAENFEIIADAVYDKGRQDEWSKFWDVYQRNGNRTNYGEAFGAYSDQGQSYWDDTIYRPKYDMHISSLDRAYRGSKITDLKAIHESTGVEFDTSNCTKWHFAFAVSELTHLPVLSCISATDIYYSFYGANKLHTIDKIILNDKGNTLFSSTFNGCTQFQNIAFEGAIGNSISFSSCSLLSTASIVNIFEHLVNSSAVTLTLKTTAKENMSFPYTSPQTNVTYNSWDELVATKPACTISLV